MITTQYYKYLVCDLLAELTGHGRHGYGAAGHPKHAGYRLLNGTYAQRQHRRVHAYSIVWTRHVHNTPWPVDGTYSRGQYGRVQAYSI